MGHLFQGRYKAILIDEESYLQELIRYIHLNPVRAKICKIPEDYEWSGHLCYLGRKVNSWLTTEYVISQFSNTQNTARLKYEEFMLEALDQAYKHAFHYGSAEGRLSGDDNFIEEVLRQADKRVEKKH